MYHQTGPGHVQEAAQLQVIHHHNRREDLQVCDSYYLGTFLVDEVEHETAHLGHQGRRQVYHSARVFASLAYESIGIKDKKKEKPGRVKVDWFLHLCRVETLGTTQ